LKIQNGGGHHLENHKNRDISATVLPIDLYEIWYGAVDKMKMISPEKTTQSLKTEPRNKREICYILCKVHVRGNGQS